MQTFYTLNSRILKANLSWSPTRAKFCQLIASLSVVLPQINMTKLKLQYLKFEQNFFVSLEFDFFSSAAQVCF